jgi:hypothetical protein
MRLLLRYFVLEAQMRCRDSSAVRNVRLHCSLSVHTISHHVMPHQHTRVSQLYRAIRDGKHTLPILHWSSLPVDCHDSQYSSYQERSLHGIWCGTSPTELVDGVRKRFKAVTIAPRANDYSCRARFGLSSNTASKVPPSIVITYPQHSTAQPVCVVNQ